MYRSCRWRCTRKREVLSERSYGARGGGRGTIASLGQDFTLSRATPSAASVHLSELIGFPISRSFTTYCVCLELRSLPSTGVTRLQRYYEPLRHPSPACPSRASGWSSLTTPWGFPCFVRFP